MHYFVGFKGYKGKKERYAKTIQKSNGISTFYMFKGKHDKITNLKV